MTIFPPHPKYSQVPGSVPPFPSGFTIPTHHDPPSPSSSLALILASLSAAAFAGDSTRTIFSDDFSSGSFGPRWGHYKSGSVVKDGMLIGITPEGSDHSAVDNVKFEGERDLEVSVKFRFVSEKTKSFNVWFDDKDYKGSHAGHLCQASISLVPDPL